MAYIDLCLKCVSVYLLQTLGNNQMMLTTTQAAERLNCHPETIRRLVKAGKLKSVALSETVRPQIRIDEKELELFIANGGVNKSFKIDVDEYQAEHFIDGIFIDPLLPEHFWTEPLENRSEEHMRLWQDLPFIVSDNGFYKIYCLDGGAWDRPSLKGGFDTQEQAINFIIEKYLT